MRAEETQIKADEKKDRQAMKKLERNIKKLEKLKVVKEVEVRALVETMEITIIEPGVYDDIQEMRTELENRGERTTVSCWVPSHPT